MPNGTVTGVDNALWQLLLEELVRNSWTRSFQIDGHEVPLPNDADGLFGTGDDTRLLKIFLAEDVQINIFLYDVGSIDFDFDLRELQTQGSLDALCAFVRSVGTTVGRDVVMTPEGWGGLDRSGSAVPPYCVYRHEADQFDLQVVP